MEVKHVRQSVAHQGSTLPVVIRSRGRVLSTRDGESLRQATGFFSFLDQ